MRNNLFKKFKKVSIKTNKSLFLFTRVLATVKNTAGDAVFPIQSILELINYVSQVLNRENVKILK